MHHMTFPRATGALPRALARVATPALIRAEARDPANVLNELTRSVSTFRSNVEGAINEDRERIDNLAAAMSAMQGQIGFNGIAPDNGRIVDPGYTDAFASYARSGDGADALRAANIAGERAQVHAAMSVGSNTDGGYLAPVEWDRKLHEKQRANSPLRRLALVQVTGVGAYTSLWSNGAVGSGWVGETAMRPQTTTPSLSPIPFGTGEVYANAAVTQRLLDDSSIKADQWLVDNLEREFSRVEAIAFLAGDGVNKPHGLLTFATGGANAAVHPGGAIAVSTSAISYDALVDFVYAVEAPYRQNAAWLMNSLTAAAIAKLKDGNNLPIWREGLVAGAPNTLLGYRVEIDEGMPAPAAGNICIAFGDFKAGYVINDRLGTRVLRDPYTNKPYVHFYATKRVGAGLLDPFALRFLKLPA